MSTRPFAHGRARRRIAAQRQAARRLADTVFAFLARVRERDHHRPESSTVGRELARRGKRLRWDAVLHRAEIVPC